MTKLQTLTPQGGSDSLRGILKYYFVGVLLAVLIVGGVAYWMLTGLH